MELRIWESLNLLTVLAQKRASDYLLWCRAEDLAGAANQAQLGHVHKLLRSYGYDSFGVLVAKSIHPMISIPDPATVPTRRFSLVYILLFSSCHPGVIFTLEVCVCAQNNKKYSCFSCVGTCRDKHYGALTSSEALRHTLL